MSRTLNVLYGYQVVRPKMAVVLVPPPPETAEERRERWRATLRREGSALAVALGFAFIGILGMAGVAYALHAPALGGLGGVAVGMVAFAIWQARR